MKFMHKRVRHAFSQKNTENGASSDSDGLAKQKHTEDVQ